MDWFPYNRDLHHERVKSRLNFFIGLRGVQINKIQIQNPVKYLRWSVLRTHLSKMLHLRCLAWFSIHLWDPREKRYCILEGNKATN